MGNTASPNSFGLNNVTESCLAQACQDSSTYLFYDDPHPTNAGHRILEDEVAEIGD